MELIIYALTCLIQPICFPLPEISTILSGTLLFGPNVAFIVGLVFIMTGISIMYFITKYLSEKYLSKVVESKSFKSYQYYVSKNPFLTTGLLFVIPVLPDEIICVGSSLGGIKFNVLFKIALFAKIISIGMVAYSDNISKIFNINQFQLIILEVVIMLLSAKFYKYIKKENRA